MHRASAAHLYDTPLSRDQVITPQEGSEYVVVEATVNDSDRLEWWVRGFGGLAERLPDVQVPSDGWPGGIMKIVAVEVAQAAD